MAEVESEVEIEEECRESGRACVQGKGKSALERREQSEPGRGRPARKGGRTEAGTWLLRLLGGLTESWSGTCAEACEVERARR